MQQQYISDCKRNTTIQQQNKWQSWRSYSQRIKRLSTSA